MAEAHVARGAVGHPEWLDDLARIMDERLAARPGLLAAQRGGGRGAVLGRIRRRFFGGPADL